MMLKHIKKEIINSHKDEILEIKNSIENIKIKDTTHIEAHPIKKETYLRLMNEFLIDSDINIYSLYNDMKKGRIEFSSKKDLGKTISAINDYDSYIYVYDPYKYITTLPHELAHAYEFSLITDREKKFEYIYSTFGETYASLEELLFSDYFLKTEFNNHVLEETLNNLYEIKLLNKKINKKNIQIDYNLELYLGKLLSVHMYYEYLNNPIKYEILLNTYKNYLITDMNGIWNIFDPNEIVRSYYEIVKYYNSLKNTKVRLF